MTPYVLLIRKQLASESPPAHAHIYDEQLQLWLDRASGKPLVETMRADIKSSQYGETTMTKTQEGADQTEVSGLRTSEFGETTNTRTQEGADQTEGVSLQSSQFGETTLTETKEGADQSESASQPMLDAAHTHF